MKSLFPIVKYFMTNMRNCFIGNGPLEGTIGLYLSNGNIYSHYRWLFFPMRINTSKHHFFRINISTDEYKTSRYLRFVKRKCFKTLYFPDIKALGLVTIIKANIKNIKHKHVTDYSWTINHILSFHRRRNRPRITYCLSQIFPCMYFPAI